jgi:ABC-type sulfate transport system substrate-binding protein
MVRAMHRAHAALAQLANQFIFSEAEKSLLLSFYKVSRNIFYQANDTIHLAGEVSSASGAVVFFGGNRWSHT